MTAFARPDRPGPVRYVPKGFHRVGSMLGALRGALLLRLSDHSGAPTPGACGPPQWRIVPTGIHPLAARRVTARIAASKPSADVRSGRKWTEASRPVQRC